MLDTQPAVYIPPNPEQGGHLAAHIHWVVGRDKKKFCPEREQGEGELDKQVPTPLMQLPQLLKAGAG
jgi:hypothetical protein